MSDYWKGRFGDLLGNRTHLITVVLLLITFAVLRASGGRLEIVPHGGKAPRSDRVKSSAPSQAERESSGPSRSLSKDSAVEHGVFDDIERKLGLKEKQAP